ncbi:MAG: hypothetical protein FWE03_03450 [Firmicutes bacterium]|nr:hypothetical protein [Bacillota bacterium]
MKKFTKAIIMAAFAVMMLLPVFVMTGCNNEQNRPMVVAGFAHSVVLREDGTVWGWGRNEEGQLGNGSRTNQARPVRFRIEPFTHGGITYQPPEYIVQVASHKVHTMALGNDGSVWAGGWNQEGQLGAPVGCRMTPIRVPFDNPDTRIIDIDAGMLFSLALSDEGNVYGWGRNRHGIMMDEVNTANPNDRISMLARASRISGAELNHPNYRITQIAAGHEHALALREDGAVIGWGRNRNGQVANIRHPQNVTSSPAEGIMPGGLLWDIPLPTVIEGLPSDSSDRVTKVIGGGFHSLALTEQGNIYVWGRSDRGQIGDGVSHSANSQPIPQRVILPQGRHAVYVAGTSGDSNAAILDNGQVIVWGRNQEGQLGIGSVEEIREDAFNPRPQIALRMVGVPLSNIVSIAVGETHMTALCGETGEALSWGTNWDGELGNNGIMISQTPLQVQRGIRGPSLGGSPPHIVGNEALTGITQLAGGHLFTLALGQDGIVHGWGRNNHGQLLMMHSNDHYIATRLEDFRVRDIRFPHIRNDWMENMNQRNPADANFAVLNNVTAISAGTDIGFSFGLAVRGGFAYGWGDNESGMLGHGYVVNRRRTLGEEPKDNNPRRMRTPAGDFINAIDVSAGGRHSLILRPNGLVYAAGHGGQGRLGDGYEITRNYPVRVAFPSATTIMQIEAGGARSFAIDSRGYLWAWGNGSYGRLGTGNDNHRNTPIRVLGPSIRAGGEQVVAVSASDVHTLALTSAGRVFSWGSGWSGRLGHGDGYGQVLPTHIGAAGLNHSQHRVVDIAVGGAHSIAIRSDGTVWTWGENGSGQLGRPTNWQQQLSPGQVSGIADAAQAAAGSAHTVIIRGSGANSMVYAWGTNSAGALGSGGRQDPPSREAIQQGADPDGFLVTPNRQLSAVRAIGVHTNYAFFNAHRADFPPVHVQGMSGAARFFIWFGIIIGILLIGLIVLFILDNRRIIDIKWPPFLRTFFDMMPIKRKNEKAKAGSSKKGSVKKKGNGAAKSKSNNTAKNKSATKKTNTKKK